MIRITLGLFMLAAGCIILGDPQAAIAQKGGNNGTIVKVDVKTGAITFKMLVPVKGTKKKLELGEKEYLLSDDAKVTINDGGEKKSMTGKEALASGLLKEGLTATFNPDGDLMLKELNVGGVAKKK